MSKALRAVPRKISVRRLLYGSAVAVPLLFLMLPPREPFFRVPYSPALYDRNGSLLGVRVAADGQWRFPPAGEPNEKFVVALIEAEDRRFGRHLGIDFPAMARAAYQNVRAGKVVSGASTLTMQTIRLSRGNRGRTLPEKAVEAVLALRLETWKSKDEILSLYAAHAPFGANVVGLEAAAWRWFGRSPRELSWAEAATLAVLPNSPGLIHPGRNRRALQDRRDALLERLRAGGHIDGETLRLALAENLPGEPLPLPRYAPHLLERLVGESGGAAAFSGNRSAVPVSTLDRELQRRTATIVERASERFAEHGIMNAAALVVNTRTGETAAYVGNSLSPRSGDVDLVAARRSSGSLLKPFLYAAMLDTGDILPSSLVSDIPTRVGSFSPQNMSRTYLGAVPADQALARSLNVPAARSLRVYGIDRFARLLRTLGLTTLFRHGDEYGLPLILGGAEVTLWEITGLYAGLGRAAAGRSGSRPGGAATGIFFPPTVFPRQAPPSAVAPLPVSPGAAWLTLRALVDAPRPGDEERWQEYAGAMRVAWKTGTSFGFRDAWAVGVTPEWTVGVWVGNASGEGRPELRSALTSAPVLFEIFSMLNARPSSGERWFPAPTLELRPVEVCAASGFLAGPDCAAVRVTDIPFDAAASAACPFCRSVLLDAETGRRVTLGGDVAPGRTVRESRFVLPPAEEWFYRRWNLDYRPLPPEENAGRTADLSGGAQEMALFNPEPGAGVFIPRELDGREGRLVFSAAHRREGETIHWHLDGDFLGSTQNFHETEARPSPGIHVITLVDGEGNTLVRRFTVLGDAE